MGGLHAWCVSDTDGFPILEFVFLGNIFKRDNFGTNWKMGRWMGTLRSVTRFDSTNQSIASFWKWSFPMISTAPPIVDSAGYRSQRFICSIYHMIKENRGTHQFYHMTKDDGGTHTCSILCRLLHHVASHPIREQIAVHVILRWWEIAHSGISSSARSSPWSPSSCNTTERILLLGHSLWVWTLLQHLSW